MLKQFIMFIYFSQMLLLVLRNHCKISIIELWTNGRTKLYNLVIPTWSIESF